MGIVLSRSLGLRPLPVGGGISGDGATEGGDSVSTGSVDPGVLNAAGLGLGSALFDGLLSCETGPTDDNGVVATPIGANLDESS